MTDSFLISVSAAIVAATSLSITIYLAGQYRQLRRDLLRTRLLSRMTECGIIIQQIMRDMERYENFRMIAFGDNPENIPDLDETLIKIEHLKNGFSDYSQDTPLVKLIEASDHIEKVLSLMQGIAAKSPGMRPTG
jgi:hypothetical protein